MYSNSIESEVFISLFSIYVRPNLEHCIQAWAPYYQKDTYETLENVQSRAIKMVKEIHHSSYEDRLKKLNLYSLVRRRKRGDLIEVLKILKNREKIDG